MINISTKENKIFTKKPPVFTCFSCFIVANPTVPHSVSHSLDFFTDLYCSASEHIKNIF